MGKLHALARSGMIPPTVGDLAACLSWPVHKALKVTNRLKKAGSIHASKWLVPSQLPAFFKSHYFWTRVDVKSDDECWLWKGSVTGGYGHLHWNGLSDYAHRIAYALSSGKKAPKGRKEHVGHMCDNKLCCNPAHLVIRSAQETVDLREEDKK